MFYKDNDSRWYAAMPDSDFSKEELEMVCGADTMLDILAQGEDIVVLTMTDEECEFDHIDLVEEPEVVGGGVYLVTSLNGIVFDFQIWLCDVTKSIFGKMPERIYLKQG